MSQRQRFEWDLAKARSNRIKHGITFEMARDAFKDALSVVELDDTGDEERW